MQSNTYLCNKFSILLSCYFEISINIKYTKPTNRIYLNKRIFYIYSNILKRDVLEIIQIDCAQNCFGVFYVHGVRAPIIMISLSILNIISDADSSSNLNDCFLSYTIKGT